VLAIPWHPNCNFKLSWQKVLCRNGSKVNLTKKEKRMPTETQQTTTNGKFKSAGQRIKNKNLSFSTTAPAESTSAVSSFSLGNLHLDKEMLNSVVVSARSGAERAFSMAKRYKFQILSTAAVIGVAGAGYMLMKRNGGFRMTKMKSKSKKAKK